MYLFAHNLLQWKNREIEKRLSSGNARMGWKLGRFWLAKEDRTPQEYYDAGAEAEQPNGNAEITQSPAVQGKKALTEVLAYAAKFQTDDGMTAYLKRVLPVLPETDRRIVEDLLKQSPTEIRKEIGRMVKA